MARDTKSSTVTVVGDQGSDDNLRLESDASKEVEIELPKYRDASARFSDLHLGSSGIEANATIMSNSTLSSKLGNGDYFHNPEDLVQFVVSGD